MPWVAKVLNPGTNERLKNGGTTISLPARPFHASIRKNECQMQTGEIIVVLVFGSTSDLSFRRIQRVASNNFIATIRKINGQRTANQQIIEICVGTTHIIKVVGESFAQTDFKTDADLVGDLIFDTTAERKCQLSTRILFFITRKS